MNGELKHGVIEDYSLVKALTSFPLGIVLNLNVVQVSSHLIGCCINGSALQYRTNLRPTQVEGVNVGIHKRAG